MPATPFHAVAPWLPFVKWPRAFSFWAITLGSMVPDLEVLPMWAVTRDIYVARGLMHSVLGVFTINAVVTAVAVWYLVPPAMRWFDRRWPGRRLFRFAGQDLYDDARDLPIVYASAVFGGLTHLLLDLPTHAYNPVWWPWQTLPFTVVPFADELWWDIVVGIPVLLAFVWMMYAYWRR